MVTSTLVDRDIDDGRKLVAMLDQTGIQVSVALWLFSAEDDVWRLVLSSAALDKDGPRKGYTKVLSAIQSLGTEVHIDLANITIMPESAGIIRSLHKSAQTGRRAHDVRLGRTYIDGTPVDDAYVYRVL